MTASNTPAKRSREVAIQVPGGAQDETTAPEGSASAKIENEVKATRENDEIDAQRLNNLAMKEDTQLAPNGVMPAAPVKKKLGRGDYRNMASADIDPSTLTAPVMTKDGWLCPPVAPATKG